MKARILLGIDPDKQPIYLTKHEWSCDWFWGFGWLGNKNLHFHMETFLIAGPDLYCAIDTFLPETKITQSEWWVILDLFKQAYALGHCAEVYRFGGYLKTRKGVTDVIHDLDKAKALNADLEKLLDHIWMFVSDVVAK